MAMCALVLASGCSGTTGTAEPARTKAAATTPGVGDCLEPMTGPLASGTRLPELVPCSQAHGGEVVSVHKLAASAAYPANSSTIQGQDDAIKTCVDNSGGAGDFVSFAGDNRLTVPPAERTSTGVSQAWAVSGVDPAVYVPGPAAWARGERWIACAAVLNNSLSAPASYSGTLRGARAKPGKLEPALAWCKLQPNAGTPRDFRSLSCTTAHNYEQLASFSAGDQKAAFPGDAALNQLATTLCAPLSSAATGGRSDTAGAAYGLSWSWPQAGEWSQGDRVVRCFVATSTGNTIGTIGSGTAAPAR